MHYDLLHKQFHTLTMDDIVSMSNVAHQLFEPLLRPLRIQHTQRKFDLKSTVRKGLAKDNFLPKYKNVKYPSRETKLVIAISLAGPCRAASIALIPLLSELTKIFNIPVYIFTSDIILAEFDGPFLANDHMLAWNHVSAPYVYSKLNTLMTTKHKNSELVLIDSFGGQNSQWYYEWTNSHEYSLLRETNVYTTDPLYAPIRQYIKETGDWSTWKAAASTHALAKIAKAIEANTTRFSASSATIEPFLTRWLLHPDKQPFVESLARQRASLSDALSSLRHNVKNIHVIIPDSLPDYQAGTVPKNHNYILTHLHAIAFIDYLHVTDHIAGLMQVISNIYFRRCTHRLTRATITYSEDSLTTAPSISTKPDDIDTPDIPILKEGKPVHFAPLDKWLPTTSFNQPYFCKSSHTTKYKQLAFATHEFPLVASECTDVGKLFLNTIDHATLSDKTATAFTKRTIASQILDHLTTHELYLARRLAQDNPFKWSATPKSTHPDTFLESYLAQLTNGVDQQALDLLKPTLTSCFSLLSSAYYPYLSELPLANIGIASRAHFIPQSLAIVTDTHSTVTSTYHELGHYIEHACPPIGMLTTADLLQRNYHRPLKTCPTEEVYPGEFAYVLPRPYIKRYSSKVYPPHHKQLPPPSEVFSTHLEYFAHPDYLVDLYNKSESTFFLLIFILAGGPVRLIQSHIEYRTLLAEQGLNHKATNYRTGRLSRSSASKPKKQGFGL